MMSVYDQIGLLSRRQATIKHDKVKKMIIENKHQKKAAAIAVILQAADKWPSTFVARSQISKFTGGLLAPGTCANADCAGVGIKGAFRVGRQIAYPCSAVTEYLISRLEPKKQFPLPGMEGE